MKKENNFLSISSYMEKLKIDQPELLRRILRNEVAVLAYVSNFEAQYLSPRFIWKMGEPYADRTIYTEIGKGTIEGFISLSPDKASSIVATGKGVLDGEVRPTKDTLYSRLAKHKFMHGEAANEKFTLGNLIDSYNGRYKYTHKNQYFYREYEKLLVKADLFKKIDNNYVCLDEELRLKRNEIDKRLNNIEEIEKVELNSFNTDLLIPYTRYEIVDELMSYVRNHFDTEIVISRDSNSNKLFPSNFFKSGNTFSIVKKIDFHQISVDDLCIAPNDYDFNYPNDSYSTSGLDDISNDNIEEQNNSDIEEVMSTAIQSIKDEFWSDYDIAYPDTIPDKHEIGLWLNKKYPFLKKGQCDSIEVVARAGRNKPSGRKPNS